MARKYEYFTIRGDDLNDRDAVVYETTILGMLHSFERWQTTWALLHGFRFYQKDVVIVPYQNDLHPCNAQGGPDWGMFPGRIRFSPGVYMESSDCDFGGPAGASPHEVLCHEMVHALRGVAGTWKKHTSGGQEERLAILVTNIFSSQLFNHELRKSHKDHAILTDPALRTSKGYLDKYRGLIELFVREHINTTSHIARANTWFNPIRELFVERHAPV
jgi:hypothetical protein